MDNGNTILYEWNESFLWMKKTIMVNATCFNSNYHFLPNSNLKSLWNKDLVCTIKHASMKLECIMKNWSQWIMNEVWKTWMHRDLLNQCMSLEWLIWELEQSTLWNHNPLVNLMNDMMHIIMTKQPSHELEFTKMVNTQTKPKMSGIPDQGFQHTLSNEAHNHYEPTS